MAIISGTATSYSNQTPREAEAPTPKPEEGVPVQEGPNLVQMGTVGTYHVEAQLRSEAAEDEAEPKSKARKTKARPKADKALVE